MSHVQRGLRSDYKVAMPVNAAVTVEVGDLLYMEVDDVRPFGQASDQGSEPANQEYAAARFAGVAETAKNQATAAESVLVDCNPLRVWRFTCPSSTWEFGDLVGPSEAGSGTALEDQQLEKVTDPAEAIGICAKREASAVTEVRVFLFSAVFGFRGTLLAGQPTGGAGGGNVETLAGTKTLTAFSPRYQILDPGGAARTVVLPALQEGLVFTIVNTADADDESILVTTAAPADLVYVRREGYVTLFCDGAVWRIVGEGYVDGQPYGDRKPQTLAGDRVLTDADHQVQVLSPNGSNRNVDLPAPSSLNRPFVISHGDGANDLVVRKTGGGATVVTISTTEHALLIPDGTDWFAVLGKAT